MRVLRGALLVALAAGAAGCEDLTLANSWPETLVLTPIDTLVTEGDQARFTVTVLDVDGRVIEGPPSWALPEWRVRPPVIEIEPDGSYTALGGGNPEVTASVAGLQAKVFLRVNPLDVELTAGALHFNQAAQDLEGNVPILAGRPALLRIFPVGDETSFFEPRARVTLYLDDEEVYRAAMEPIVGRIPTEVSQTSFERSFNTVIPGSIVQPGLQLVVELDPDGIVPAAPGSTLRIPETGAMDVNVVKLPVHIQTIVPTIHTPHPREEILDWVDGMHAGSPELGDLRTLMPISEMEVIVHDTYYSDIELEPDGGGWSAWLREITLLWELEGQVGNYYGVATLPYTSGVVGQGNLPPTGTLASASVGWPRERTLAHEVGHSMSLRHAPCGGAGGPDPRYPYSNGSIGIVGYDFSRQTGIHPSNHSDIMSYCRPHWVSDFSFSKALQHRILTENPEIVQARAATPETSTLILWGSAGDGELLLEPAFHVVGKPRVPATGGPYRLEGFREDGELGFGFDFTPIPTELGGAHFSFAVPYDPDRDGPLQRVVLSGPDGEFELGPASTRPMAIIMSRSSGQVRAMVRDWRGSAAAAPGDTEILVSDGLPRRVR